MKGQLKKFSGRIELPFAFHFNLAEIVKIGKELFLFMPDHSIQIKSKPELQRMALQWFLYENFGLKFSRFKQIIKNGIFYGYPQEKGNFEIDKVKLRKAPLFSLVGWRAFYQKAFLTILRAVEEGEKLAFILKGEKGTGKSWLIRRATELGDFSLLLDAAEPKAGQDFLSFLSQIPPVRKVVVAVENFQEADENFRELMNLLWVRLKSFVLVLEGGDFEEGFPLEIIPPSPQEWRNNFCFFLKEKKERLLNFLLKNYGPNPGEVLRGLVEISQNEEMTKDFAVRKTPIIVEKRLKEKSSLLDDVRERLRSKQFRKALNLLDGLLEEEEVLKLKAKANFFLQNYRETLKNLQKLKFLSQEERYLLAESLFRLKEPRKAEKILGTPWDDKSLFLLAKVKLALGKKYEAIKLLQQSKDVTSQILKALITGETVCLDESEITEPEALNLFGKYLLERGKGIKAEYFLRKALDKALEEGDLYLSGVFALDLGNLYYQAANFDEAENYYSLCLKLLSSFQLPAARSLAAFNLGEIRFKKGDWHEAEQLFRSSYEVNSKEKGLSFYYDCAALGYMKFLKGEFKEAESFLKTAWKGFKAAGAEKEQLDVGFKLFELYYEKGECWKGLLNEELSNERFELWRTFFTGELPEKPAAGDPWSLLLYSLRRKQRKGVLMAADLFSKEDSEYEKHLVYYYLVKEGLWKNVDFPLLKAAARWFKKRGCFRAERIEKLFFLREKGSIEKFNFQGDRERGLENLLKAMKSLLPGQSFVCAIIDERGNVLERSSIVGKVPWGILRSLRKGIKIEDVRNACLPEAEEVFLSGNLSFVFDVVEKDGFYLCAFAGSRRVDAYEELHVRILNKLLSQAKEELEIFKSGLGLLKGASRKMQRVYFLIKKAAESSLPVLIYGESGTGKELVARTIYQLSRNQGNFVSLNCAALPENLVESELFGYVAGAFTGALRNKPGLVELAEGGTLFLDEIGELPLSVQAKLLRVLQEGETRRIGATQGKKVKFHLISATNRDLEVLVKEGKFRADLYYRIRVIPIHLPPLRERKEDIPFLVRYFLDKYGRKKVKVHPEAMNLLLSKEWRGNVRELENEIRYACVFLEKGEEVLRPEHLRGEEVKEVEENYEKARRKWEKNFLIFLLEKYSWDKTKTASAMGITRQHLLNLMKKHGLMR